MFMCKCKSFWFSLDEGEFTNREVIDIDDFLLCHDVVQFRQKFWLSLFL